MEVMLEKKQRQQRSLICKAEGVVYLNLACSGDADTNAMFTKMQWLVHECYLVVLHFKRLNCKTCSKLHKEVHKGYQFHSFVTMLKRSNRTIFLEGKHYHKNRQDLNAAAILSTGCGLLPRVTCIQLGKLEEHEKGILSLTIVQYNRTDNNK